MLVMVSLSTLTFQKTYCPGNIITELIKIVIRSVKTFHFAVFEERTRPSCQVRYLKYKPAIYIYIYIN